MCFYAVFKLQLLLFFSWDLKFGIWNLIFGAWAFEKVSGLRKS
jgi:hypothetical protein